MLIRLCCMLGVLALPALAQTGTSQTLAPQTPATAVSAPQALGSPVSAPQVLAPQSLAPHSIAPNPGKVEAAPSAAPVSNKRGRAPTGSAAAGPSDDRNFIKALAEASLADTALAKAAETKSNRYEVKSFAQQMAKDQAGVTKRLGEFAGQAKVSLPAQLDDRRKSSQAKIEQASAQNFDAAYMASQIQSLRRAAVLCERHALAGENLALRKFASSRLPVIRQLLRQAESISSGVSNSVVASAAPRQTSSGSADLALGSPAQASPAHASAGKLADKTTTKP
jgi:predicted outer membrane protein